VAGNQLTDEQRKQREQARIRKNAAEAEERAARRLERDAPTSPEHCASAWVDCQVVRMSLRQPNIM